MTKTTCPHCGAEQDVPSNYVGQVARCLSCDKEYAVRDPAKVAKDAKSKQNPGEKGKLLAIVGCVVAVVAITVALFVAQPDEVVEPTAEAPAGVLGRVEVKEPSRSSLFDFLDAGTMMRNLTEQDPTYDEFSEGVADVLNSWNLAKSDWPANLPDKTAFSSFERSAIAWYACLKLWKLKRGKEEPPTAPDISDWEFFSTNFKGELAPRTHPRNYVIKEHRGRAFLPFDENIEALLKIGAENFSDGKDRIFDQIK